ncbi:PAN2-PAN3 deadenylation complex catalytic subunit PAN2-like [Saccostrea cucullata]|uniref:PAN2-PAN3 deadenylation complex catalytic subunit PAN2-like n=1 Tax=Saccostrea cuccullata TaxID=36930 RepID=UPI002ED44124
MNFNRMPLHPQFPSPSHLPPNAGPPPMPPNPGHIPQGMPPPPHLPQHMGHGGGHSGPDLGRNDGMMMQGHYTNQDVYTSGGDLNQDFMEMNNILVDGGDRFGVSTLCYDTQELLWMGNQGGHVTSYFGLELQKYTSFQIHVNEDVRQIVPLARGVLSLTQSCLACNNRRGVPIFTYRGPTMHNMQCMMMTGPSTVIIGGHQTKVIEIEVEHKEVIREVDIPEPGCAILRGTNKYICAGDTAGKVTLFDHGTMKPEHVLDAHTGTLSDFDIQGNLLVTCGFSTRHSNLTADRFLMVYDLRVMRAMAPIQVIIDPMFLRFVSTYNNKMVITSQAGQFQIIETTAMTPSSMNVYPINTHGSPLLSFDISNSCQALAFGDSGGYLHLFALGEHPCYNQYPEQTEFPDPIEPIQPIHITDEYTPYSIIPMMYPTNGTLLSDWPEYLSQRTYRKPKPLDADILRSMKMQHNVGYAQNPGKEKRNQIPYVQVNEKSKKGKGAVPESPIGRMDDPFIKVPKRFRKVDLKYSKLGLEDFDFRHYNKTHFAGLETDIPNAYCNCMLQVLYFIEPLRCSLLSHLCEREFCLACELGFLFHMLDNQKGQTCQASNFLRAFRTIPEASALSLVLAENEENDPRINLSRLIQSWQRFLYQQVHAELCNKSQPVKESKSEENLNKSSESLTKSDENLSEQLSEVSLKTEEVSEVSLKTEEEASKPEEKSVETTPPKSKKKKKKKGKKKGKEQLEEEKAEKETEGDKGSETAEDEGKEGDKSEEGSTDNPSTEKTEEKSSISEILGFKIVTTLRCRCGQETQRQSDTNIINLSYPDCNPPGSNRPPFEVPFCDVLKSTLTAEQNMQTWCNVCDRYQPHTQIKTIQSVPDVVAVNCHIENARDYEFWKMQHMILKQRKEEYNESSSQTSFMNAPGGNPVMCRYGNACRRGGCKFRHERDMLDPAAHNYDEDIDCQWIPLGLMMDLHPDGTLNVEEYPDDQPVPRDAAPTRKYYEILAVIYHIRDEKTAGNLVTCINVGETYHQRKEKVTCTQWYLFNDFSILPIEKHEACAVNMDWKVPCTIYFKRRQLTKFHDLTVTNPITIDVLREEFGLVNPASRKVTFDPLSEDEFPQEGDVVALDAEFVSLNQEESELRSDGTRSMIKPSHLTCARMTCLRGKGEKKGIPFIDDYISTQEQVVDYLTQWSGISPGDLNPELSTKHLTTLKSTYVKLRYLVDTKVVFVGHGLKKDFRVINITVPKDQIVDTVQLFYIPRQRMISLKYLAWYFLKTKIQSSTHDSVEDANTALQLYDKYQEVASEGSDKIRAVIKEMYDVGRKDQWKIPDVDDTENPLDMLQFPGNNNQ